MDAGQVDRRSLSAVNFLARPVVTLQPAHTHLDAAGLDHQSVAQLERVRWPRSP